MDPCFQLVEALCSVVSGHPQEEDEDETRQTHLSQDQKQQLSKFLAEFPIRPLYAKSNHAGGLWCFWSQKKSSQTNSSFNNLESPDPWMIHEKMKSALAKLRNRNYGLIQFWVPVTRSGRRLLTTCHQPFAVTSLNTDIAKHRICCENYLYDVDVISVETQVEDDTLVINGPLATAFLNHLPQLIFDLRRYSLKKHLYPLLTSALEHGLIGYLVLPLFDPSRTCCVGVLEFCMSEDDVIIEYVLDELIAAIKGADLITFDAQECQPYKSIDGLLHASDEIKGALKTVCVSHNLCLAQAWIRYEDKNHVSFSSSNCIDFDFMRNKRGLALKLFDYCDDEGDGAPDWISFCIECHIHPLRMGEGLVGKQLENHEPYLCKDISMVDKNESSLSHTASIRGSCFTICLRSTYTRYLDYVLEFFWTNGRDVIILLESIMFTLKRTLPSFKVVTGKEIGNELRVKEIKYSNEANKCIVEDIVILHQSNKISNKKYKTSPISLHREVIEQQFGRTMIEAAKNLDVCLSTLKRKCKEVGINEWQGPKLVKRKVSEFHENQKDTNGDDIRAIHAPLVVNQDSISDGTVLTIKATYKDNLIKFSLPFSTTILQAVEEEILKIFALKNGAYNLKYYDEDKDLVSITCDKHFRDCVKSSRLLNSTTVRLHVVPIV